MEAKTESDPVVNPSFQSPLKIALGVAGKVASPAVAFDANSLVKTVSESPENPNQIEVRTEDETVVIDESNLANYAGKPVLYDQTPVGVAMGLSMTPIDGLAWYVQTTLVGEGEAIGCFNVMGQVAEDTRRSGRIAYIVAQQILLQKQPDNTFFAKSNLCLNLPRANGSSAGCTLTTSLLSLAMKKPVRKGLAMTGEITPTGRILMIGGVKEKTIAAKRSQVKTIIFPEANRREFDELAEDVKEGLDVHFVDEYDQIFDIAFNYDH